MRLAEVLQQVRVGDSFYRASKPDVLYDRIGALIERNGLGWATIGYGHGNDWEIVPEMKINEDLLAADWTILKGNLKEYDPSAKPPKLKANFTEKTRHGWTCYDQMETPAGN